MTVCLDTSAYIEPVNDVWIAATALVEAASIVSYDRHFDEFGLIPRIAP